MAKIIDFKTSPTGSMPQFERTGQRAPNAKVEVALLSIAFGCEVLGLIGMASKSTPELRISGAGVGGVAVYFSIENTQNPTIQAALRKIHRFGSGLKVVKRE